MLKFIGIRFLSFFRGNASFWPPAHIILACCALEITDILINRIQCKKSNPYEVKSSYSFFSDTTFWYSTFNILIVFFFCVVVICFLFCYGHTWHPHGWMVGCQPKIQIANENNYWEMTWNMKQSYLDDWWPKASFPFWICCFSDFGFWLKFLTNSKFILWNIASIFRIISFAQLFGEHKWWRWDDGGGDDDEVGAACLAHLSP